MANNKLLHSSFVIDRRGTQNEALVTNPSELNGENAKTELCTGLYCDTCLQNVNRETALNHLHENSHISISRYEVLVMEQELPLNAVMLKAEEYSIELPLTKANIINVCTSCDKKHSYVKSSPLSVFAHHRDVHQKCKYLECCACYKLTTVTKSLDLMGTMLADLESRNVFPCLGCEENFLKINDALNHMYKAKHNLLEKHWKIGKNQKQITVAVCVNCSYGDTLITSNTTLLYHLVKVHGKILNSSDFNLEATDKVTLDIRQYELLELRKMSPFSDLQYMNLVLEKHLLTSKKSLKRKTGFIKSLANEATPPEEPVLNKQDKPDDIFSPSSKTKLYQQYCCDLCHVPLGMETSLILTHMSTFNHPSTSLYNTEVNAQGETVLKSMHNYAKYQHTEDNLKTILCRCTFKGCKFIASDPVICAIHQIFSHHRIKEDVLVDFLHLHTTSTFKVTVSSNGSMTCPLCNQSFSKRSELTNHMAGSKHTTLIDGSEVLADVGRCNSCEFSMRGIFINEIALLDHLLLHKHAEDRVNLQYTVNSFKKKDSKTFLPFDTEWMEIKTTIAALESIIKSPTTSKSMVKRYRKALGEYKNNHSSAVKTN